MGRLTTVMFVGLLVPAAVSAQTRIEKNVIYGMYSGLALLMDVHRPEVMAPPSRSMEGRMENRTQRCRTLSTRWSVG